MARVALALTIAAAPLMAGTAYAQDQGSPSGQPADVTVRAPERMVCRQVTRTATRMRSNRVCRPVSQWHASGQQSDEEQIAEAADRLDALGADDISTGCLGGDDNLDRTPDTPLGPR